MNLQFKFSTQSLLKTKKNAVKFEIIYESKKIMENC